MLHDQWTDHLQNLRACGAPIGPRGLMTREFLDVELALDSSAHNLLDVPGRCLNFRFAVAEWLWMAFGRSDVASLAQYNSVMRQFSDDGLFLTGAYGPHIGAQWRRVADKLRWSPDTRQAVIEIPRPRGETKDEPCTLSLQFLQRGGRLHLIATMRSSDVWLGLPYDVFAFTQLQNMMAGELGVARGWFTLHAGSSHLYDRDLSKADAVLGDSGRAYQTLASPALPGRPPTWLEEVLIKRTPVNAPQPIPPADMVWLPYAQVLLARSSADARRILVDAGK